MSVHIRVYVCVCVLNKYILIIDKQIDDEN